MMEIFIRDPRFDEFDIFIYYIYIKAMVQGCGDGGRQRVHIRNVHSLMSLLPLCYSTHKSSFCEEERVQRWPSFSLSSSTGGENGCVPKDFNQKHAGCRETSGVFCCERGSGFRVQGCGGGFAANIYGAMPEGLLIAGFPRIVSLPLEGKVPRWGG
jgi:hypothetical protein